MVTKSRLLSSFVVFAALSSTPVSAEPVDVPIDGYTVAHRINVAGRQRMLTQRMSKFFCLARSNVNPVESAATLTKAIELFDVTHLGLRDGNEDQNLFTEEDAKVLNKWSEVDGQWMVLKGIYDAALGGEFVSESDFDHANRLTNEVMKRANDLVVFNRAAYSAYLGDGAVGEALLIDLYGRQRMLSQKLSKEVCQLAAGYAPESTQPELEATFKLFDNSINAFVEGLPIAGVPKPPSPEIAEQLGTALAEWLEVKAVADAVIAGNAVSLSELGAFSDGMDRFLVEMNLAVQMLANLNANKS